MKMHVRQIKPFEWQITDYPNVKGQTVRFDLEYDVIDREFHCSAFVRPTPRHYWPKLRPGTATEKEIALTHLPIAARAACVAESINPNIWARARKAVERRLSSFVGMTVVGLINNQLDSMAEALEEASSDIRKYANPET